MAPGDFVKVECVCGHSELIPAVGLLHGMRLPPHLPIHDLAPRLRCRECDAKGEGCSLETSSSASGCAATARRAHRNTALFAGARVELHLSLSPNHDPKVTASCCYLYVEDADALHAVWQASNVAGRLGMPGDTPYGLREFAHVDPEGNLLRVGSPLRAMTS